jgi:hypothetical protein
LKLTPDDIARQKLIIRDPKSGREQEVIFIPQKIADRLREYINSKNIKLNHKRFSPAIQVSNEYLSYLGDLQALIYSRELYF